MRIILSMRIDLILSDNPFHSTGFFAEQLGEALREEGAQVRFLSFVPSEQRDSLMALVERPPDLAISFSFLTALGPAEERWCFKRCATLYGSMSEVWLSDYFSFPFLFYWIDAPCFALSALRSEHAFLSFVDEREWQRFLRQAPERLLFLPHAVNLQSFEEGERPQALFMSASFLDPLRHKSWKARFPTDYRKMEEALHLVLYEEWPLFDALRAVLLPEKLPIYWEVEYAAKAIERCQLLEMLHPFPVDLVGPKAWRSVTVNLPHVTLHPESSYSASQELMRRSRLVLNSSPQFRQGSHERVFGALAAGAMAITSHNLYLAGEFQAGGVLFFRNRERDALLDQVAKQLSDEAGRQEAVLHGREQLAKNHSWSVRAKTIIARFGSARSLPGG